MKVSLLRGEEEATLRELRGLVLHGCEVACEGCAGDYLAVVRARWVETIDRGPDGEHIVHNWVDS